MNLSGQAWGWLQRELDVWGERELQADFWWRDDDAVAASPQLERLMQIGDRHGVPLSLAVIPASLQQTLPKLLQSHRQISVLQHGYSHQSHARPGHLKLELGGERDPAHTLADLRLGQQVLQDHFGARFTPVLVPPWNRIDPSVVLALPGLGFTGISTMRVRRRASPAPGLLQVNAHLDPVNWRQQRGFIGLYPSIAILVQHLLARRSGYRDFAEPTGILSHHLAQNDAVWHFLDDLFNFLEQHPAACWRSAESIWKASVG